MAGGGGSMLLLGKKTEQPVKTGDRQTSADRTNEKRVERSKKDLRG
jgi:hypothetical protein